MAHPPEARGEDDVERVARRAAGIDKHRELPLYLAGHHGGKRLRAELREDRHGRPRGDRLAADALDLTVRPVGLVAGREGKPVDGADRQAVGRAADPDHAHRRDAVDAVGVVVARPVEEHRNLRVELPPGEMPQALEDTHACLEQAVRRHRVGGALIRALRRRPECGQQPCLAAAVLVDDDLVLVDRRRRGGNQGLIAVAPLRRLDELAQPPDAGEERQRRQGIPPVPDRAKQPLADGLRHAEPLAHPADRPGIEGESPDQRAKLPLEPLGDPPGGIRGRGCNM
ncbi:MAG: hypothetical protein ACYTFF_17350 [Planctomycetota bacterium]